MQNSTVIRCENSVWLMRVIGIQTVGSWDQNDSDGWKGFSLNKRHGKSDEGRREGGKGKKTLQKGVIYPPAWGIGGFKQTSS